METLPTLLPQQCTEHSINQGQIRALKLWYYFYFSALFTRSFLPLILQEVMNFQPGSIGALMSMRRFITFLGAPLFGVLCDVTLMHRRVLIISLTCYFFCTFLLTRFQSLLAVTIILFFREGFCAGCESAMNTATFAKLAALCGPFSETRFGSVRMWGSFGWGVTSLIVPFMCDKLFSASLEPILYAQILIGIPVVLLLFKAVDLSPRLFREAREKPAVHSGNFDAADTHPDRSSNMLAVLCVFAALEQGVVLGTIETTFVIYLARIGVSSTIIGLSIFLWCVAEWCMFFADHRVRCLISNENRVIQIGIIVNTISLCSYSLLQYIPKDSLCRVITILGTEFIGGIGEALFTSSILQTADRVAPPEWKTGGQSVANSVMFGVGPGLGAMVGGWAFETFGINIVYGSLVVCNVLTILVFEYS